MKDFIKDNQHTSDARRLKRDYGAYKAQWKERMVEFLIEQLGISEENAEEAKKNPDNYFINYDVYKLFASDR
jgi:hypothetical protein